MKLRLINNNKRSRYIIKKLKLGYFIYELIDGRYIKYE